MSVGAAPASSGSVGRRPTGSTTRPIELNDAIESAVASAARSTGADIAFVDVVDEFDNHGSCRFWQRDRYVNDRVTGETYSRQLDPYGNVVDRYTDTWLTVSGASFHPSGKGYDAYYRALDAAV